jgi:hypothetical protein
MKMSNKKFLSIAASLGLSLGLLSACAPAVEYDDDDDDDRKKKRTTSSGGTFIPANGAKVPSSGLTSGSKGIGGVKGGGAGS